MRLDRFYLAMVASIAMGCSTASAAAKIAVIDETAILHSSKIRKELKPFEQKQVAEQANMEKLATQIQTLRAEYDQNEAVMDDKTRAETGKKLAELSQEFQTRAKNRELEMRNVSGRLEQQLRDAATTVAKEHNVDLLCKKQATAYASAKLDLTQDVIKAL